MHNFHMKNQTGPNSNNGSFHFKVVNMIKGIDMFARPMPGFNLKGVKSVNSLLGTICTLMIFFCLSIYAAAKFVQLRTYHNPNISTHNEVHFYKPDDPINLNKVNFRFAVSFEDYYEQQTRYDERFVRYIIRLVYNEDSVEKERLLNSHLCTDEDYNEFYPIWEE